MDGVVIDKINEMGIILWGYILERGRGLRALSAIGYGEHNSMC